MLDITNPIFADGEKAREYLEEQRWPNGPVCPHDGCGAKQQATKLKGKSTRPGVYKCKACGKPFSVTVGTVFERSKIPLNKWVAATYLMTTSKKGISALQIQRMLNVTYKTAWFMCQRIRMAMAPVAGQTSPIGGRGRIVESDETFVGGKKKNVHRGKPTPKKHAVQALVERGGEARVRHVADVTAKSLRATLVTQVHHTSTLNTDEALAYYWTGHEFANHSAVNHSAGEYVSKDGGTHIQSAEASFAILKRKVYVTHHAISEAHLHRYVAEAEFMWNNRIKLGIGDTERANNALKGIGRQAPDIQDFSSNRVSNECVDCWLNAANRLLK